MPTPWKPDYTSYSSVGAVVDDLKAFIDLLFGTDQHNFRNKFFDDPNDEANSTLNEPIIRRMLRSHRIDIPETHTDPLDGQTHNIRIVIVDIENARMASYKQKKVLPVPQDFGREEIHPTDWFYLLVMPPVPRNSERKDVQTYESAWHHAIVDSYGM
jgi:hypothetical protein